MDETPVILPSWHSLAVRLTPRTKRTCLFAFLDVRNAISTFLRHLIVLVFYLYDLNELVSIFFRRRAVKCTNSIVYP